MMSLIRRHTRLLVLAASCTAIGAGASAVASAGAASGSSAATAHAAHVGRTWRGVLRRAVHGDVIVATKSGFATVTFDRGLLRSVSGQQLTLSEGTKKATYKTVTLTLPSSARVRDNGKAASLSDLTSGQRVLVVQGPRRTLVIAHSTRSS
jgi:hypothetical protein